MAGLPDADTRAFYSKLPLWGKDVLKGVGTKGTLKKIVHGEVFKDAAEWILALLDILPHRRPTAARAHVSLRPILAAWAVAKAE